MTQFVGTHVNKLDKKGRVSVPAVFRGALDKLGNNELILRPSHRWPCIEAWPREAFEAMAEGMNNFPEFSDEHDDMGMAIFGDACEAAPDGEGRIMMSEDLIAHATLAEAVAFVGIGKTFQIWDKATLEQRKQEARMRAQQRGMTMPATGPAATRGAA